MFIPTFSFTIDKPCQNDDTDVHRVFLLKCRAKISKALAICFSTAVVDIRNCSAISYSLNSQTCLGQIPHDNVRANYLSPTLSAAPTLHTAARIRHRVQSRRSTAVLLPHLSQILYPVLFHHRLMLQVVQATIPYHSKQ